MTQPAQPAMQALQIMSYGAPLALNDVPRPVPTGRQVLVRVQHCGMCHSDLHIHSGGFAIGGGQVQSVAGSHTLPFTLGHEIEGTVAQLGPEATPPPGLALGSAVAVYPWIGCGTCPACHRGEENLCDNPASLGIREAGGYATHVLVPDARYLLPADGLPPGQAGLLMCSGLTAYAALQRLRMSGPTEPWLLLGAGGVGLTALYIARALGLAAPCVIDPSEPARAAALAAGAHAAWHPSDQDALAAAIARTGGFAGALDVVGTETTLATALATLRKGGAAVVVGLYGGLLTTPVLQFPARQLRLEGSFTGTLAQAAELLALARTGAVPPIPVIHRKLAGGQAALEDLQGRKVVGRIVLDME
jgi:D-arabinose 1-dehydrogenase-like Zn-dependent alcohol dehydrogenase